MKFHSTMKTIKILIFASIVSFFSVIAEDVQSLTKCMSNVDADHEAECIAHFKVYFQELDIDEDGKLSQHERHPLFSSPIDNTVLPIYFPDGKEDLRYEHFCASMKTFKLPKLKEDVNEDILNNFCEREQMIIAETCWDDWKVLFPDKVKKMGENIEAALTVTKMEFRDVMIGAFDTDTSDWDEDRFVAYMLPNAETDHLKFLFDLHKNHGLEVALIDEYREPVNNCPLARRRKLPIFTVTAAIFVIGVVTASVTSTVISEVAKDGGTSFEDFFISLTTNLIGNGLTSLACSTAGIVGCALSGAAAGLLSGMANVALCEVFDTNPNCLNAEALIWNAALSSASGLGGKFMDDAMKGVGVVDADRMIDVAKTNGVLGGLSAFATAVLGKDDLDTINPKRDDVIEELTDHFSNSGPPLICPMGFVLTFPTDRLGECQQHDRNDGEDYVNVDSLQECGDACTNKDECFAFDWNGSSCYINEYCDYQESDSYVSCRKFRTCPKGYTLQFPGHPMGECQQNTNNDKETTASNANDLFKCAEACDDDDDCVTFDYLGTRCFLNEYCDKQDPDDDYLACRKIGKVSGYRTSRINSIAQAASGLHTFTSDADAQVNVVYKMRGSRGDTDSHIELYATDMCNCPTGIFDFNADCHSTDCDTLNCRVNSRSEVPPNFISAYMFLNGAHLFRYDLPSQCNKIPRVIRCRDTPGWTNNGGFGCDHYATHWCDAVAYSSHVGIFGRFKPGWEWTGKAGHTTGPCAVGITADKPDCAAVYNYPGQNCCACGKPFEGIKRKSYLCNCPTGFYNGARFGNHIHCSTGTDRWGAPEGYDTFPDPTARGAWVYEYTLPTICNGNVV